MSLQEKKVLFGFEFQSLEILATHSLTFYLHSLPLSSFFPDSLLSDTISLSFLTLFPFPFLLYFPLPLSVDSTHSLTWVLSLTNAFSIEKTRRLTFKSLSFTLLLSLNVSSGRSHSTHPLFFTHPLSHLLTKREGKEKERKRMEGREERMGEEGRENSPAFTCSLFSFPFSFPTPSILTCLSAH